MWKQYHWDVQSSKGFANNLNVGDDLSLIKVQSLEPGIFKWLVKGNDKDGL